jgi:YegS/Rv2252/BmrU family lipid kinase
VSTHLAIVNPVAGGGRCGKRAPGVIAALRDAGVEIDVVETGAAGDATDIVRREWAAGRRSFIGVGGDGTTWEIVNGLFPDALASDERPAVGFLPLGTGNSFLRDFTDDGARYAIEYIRDGRRRPIDVIRARHADGEMFYTNILSIGFTADVGALVNRSLKGLGDAGYGAGVFWKVARLDVRPLPWALDDEPVDRGPVVFLSFNNSKFTGGKMRMAPHADCSDGLIEVVVVREMGRFELMRTFPKIFDGTHVQHPRVEERQARVVRFDLGGPVDVMVDGEVLRLALEKLDVLPLALEVMA